MTQLSSHPPPHHPYPDHRPVTRPCRSFLPRFGWLSQRLLSRPPHTEDAHAPASSQVQYAREQILAGLLRMGVGFGTLTLFVAALPWLNDTPPQIYAINIVLLGLVWIMALYRQISYCLRASALMLCLYVIGCTELVYYGFSQDATLLFAFFSLLGLLLFNHRAGRVALALSSATLASVGLLIGIGRFTPLAHPAADLSISTVITTCMIFLMVVGCIQMGMALLFDHLESAWQHEYQARALLEQQHQLLERRVAERTHELALAHEHADAARHSESAQKEYLAALHQLTLELLHRHDIGEVLQIVVDRSAAVLNAPYSELMLNEGDELVVWAFTSNQSFLVGDRVRRDEARLSWQAYDTGYPAVVDDYSSYATRRECYAALTLHAVADFPILVGATCIGVLGLGRATPGHIFTPDDIQKGTLLAQLAGMLVENARLYDTALCEIAEREKGERMLRQQAIELQAQNAELDAFAHTVAHDLKTPLTGLIGHSQVLLQIGSRLAQQDVDHSLRSIIRVGKKMAAIINELLLLAHVRSSGSVTRAVLPMRDIIAEAEARLHDPIKDAGATLSYAADWPTAVGYAPWVEEVWVNYISNAIKYGGKPAFVELGAEPAGVGYVRFWVQDNGLGLSAEQQAKLFMPFTRLQSGHMPGHGLGLSIVQRIITQLQGAVGVESVPGQGCRFYFTLPACPSAHTSDADDAKESLAQLPTSF